MRSTEWIPAKGMPEQHNEIFFAAIRVRLNQKIHKK